MTVRRLTGKHKGDREKEGGTSGDKAFRGGGSNRKTNYAPLEGRLSNTYPGIQVTYLVQGYSPSYTQKVALLRFCQLQGIITKHSICPFQGYSLD